MGLDKGFEHGMGRTGKIGRRSGRRCSIGDDVGHNFRVDFILMLGRVSCILGWKRSLWVEVALIDTMELVCRRRAEEGKEKEILGFGSLLEIDRFA